MTQPAQHCPAQPASTSGASPVDRIDVVDQHGTSIGWMDPTTGVRSLLDPARRAEFEDTVNFWLTAAGLTDELPDGGEGPSNPHHTSVREVRYPDPDVTRSLVIPLLRMS